MNEFAQRAATWDEMRARMLKLADSHLNSAASEKHGHGDCESCQLALDVRTLVSVVEQAPVCDPAPPDLEALSDDELSDLWHDGALEDRDGGWFYDNEESPVRLRAALKKLFGAVRGVRDPQPELGNDIRRLKIALAAAISALKAGEPWHYSGCAGCAEIEAAMIGGPPPKETPQ